MATKAPVDTSTHINFILSALSNADSDIKIDWNQVAKDNKIGYARNAATKFKETVKKYGYKFENNNMMKIDLDGENGRVTGSAVSAHTPATPRIGGTSKAKKPTSTTPAAISAKRSANGVQRSSAKKRKVETIIDDDEGEIEVNGEESDVDDAEEDDDTSGGDDEVVI